MDKCAKKCTFLGGLQKWMVNALFKFSNFQMLWQKSSRWQRELKSMVPKGSPVTPHNTMAWAKICPKANNTNKLGPSSQHKWQVAATTPNKGDCQRGKSPKVKIKIGDIKDKRCSKCGKFGHFQVVYPDIKVNVKANHVCAVDQILKSGFVAKASSLKPKPSLLYLDECFKFGWDKPKTHKGVGFGNV